MNKRLLTNNKELQFSKDLPNLKEETIQKVSNDVIVRKLIPSFPTYLDQYLSGCAQMHIHIGWLDERPIGEFDLAKVGRQNKRDYCIILKKLVGGVQDAIISNRFSETTCGKAKSAVLSTTTNSNKLAVLISVFQAIDDSQRDDIGVNLLPEKTGVVRLHRYDDCFSFRVDTINIGVKAFSPVGIIDHEITTFVFGKDVFKDNWEASIISSLFGDTSDNDIIKCTSQVMYEITEHNGNHGIRLLSDMETPPDFIVAIRQPDANKLVRVAVCIPLGFLLDVYHVLLCPLVFEPPIFIHDVLQYPYGEESEKDTKNPKGVKVW